MRNNTNTEFDTTNHPKRVNVVDLTKVKDKLVMGKADQMRNIIKETLSGGQGVEEVLNEALI